jgi:hypothetical protein
MSEVWRTQTCTGVAWSVPLGLPSLLGEMKSWNYAGIKQPQSRDQRLFLARDQKIITDSEPDSNFSRILVCFFASQHNLFE